MCLPGQLSHGATEMTYSYPTEREIESKGPSEEHNLNDLERIVLTAVEAGIAFALPGSSSRYYN